jgi:hypothetical protein
MQTIQPRLFEVLKPDRRPNNKGAGNKKGAGKVSLADSSLTSAQQCAAEAATLLN